MVSNLQAFVTGCTLLAHAHALMLPSALAAGCSEVAPASWLSDGLEAGQAAKILTALKRSFCRRLLPAARYRPRRMRLR